MRSRIMAQAPSYITPRYPGTDIPQGTPLPSGTTVEQIVTHEPNGLNADKLVAWVQTFAQAGRQAQQVTVAGPVAPGVDFGALAVQVASGAAAGAGIAGVGAIAGAVVAVVAWIAQNWSALFGPGPNPNYANSAVHSWATANLPQAVLDYARSLNSNFQFQSIEQMAEYTLAYWLDTYGAVLVDGQGTRFYSNRPDDVYIQAIGGAARAAAFYRQAGVDYGMTKEQRLATNNADQRNIIQYGVRVNVPGQTDLGPGEMFYDAAMAPVAALATGAIVIGGLYLATRNS